MPSQSKPAWPVEIGLAGLETGWQLTIGVVPGEGKLACPIDPAYIA